MRYLAVVRGCTCLHLMRPSCSGVRLVRRPAVDRAVAVHACTALEPAALLVHRGADIIITNAASVFRVSLQFVTGPPSSVTATEIVVKPCGQVRSEERRDGKEGVRT